MEEKENIAEGVVRAMLDICHKGGTIALEDDLGGNTLTVSIYDKDKKGGHTHVGVPDGSFQTLLEHLSSVLSGGSGLSFYPETPDIYR